MNRKSWIAAIAVATFGATALSAGPGDRAGMGHGARSMIDFSALDADGDGMVTPQEVQAQSAERFAEMDGDGDGTVTAEEMQAHMAAQMAERMAERTERMITWYDTDGDGALSIEEMQPGQGAMRMFGRLDSDGDGAVSQEEFDAARERFAERRGNGRERGKNHRMRDN